MLDRDMGSAWRDLEQTLPGRVGGPRSPLWEAARRVYSRAGRMREPLGVVRPADVEQIVKTLAWGRKTGVSISIRSGGHSFDGFPVQPTSVLLDLRDLARVAMGDDGMVRVMPGATVIDVTGTLAAFDLALPLGDCPTVGMGGLVSGGGFGYLSRCFGLACDSLVGATIVTGNGDVIVATASSSPDHLWACRGGAGAGGVIAELVLAPKNVARVTLIKLAFSWKAGAAVIEAYDEVMATAPVELDLKLKIRTTGPERFIDFASDGPNACTPGEPIVELDGQFLGSEGDARALVSRLVSIEGILLVEVVSRSFQEAALELVPIPLLMNPAPEGLRPVRNASDFTKSRLSSQDIASIVFYIDTLQSRKGLCGGAVLIEPADGATRNVAPEASAFPHREAALLIEWVLLGTGAGLTELRPAHDELLGLTREAMSANLTKGRYVNYADELDDARQFWGGNLERLHRIAAAADPTGVLSTRLRPAPGDGEVRPDASPPGRR